MYKWVVNSEYLFNFKSMASLFQHFAASAFLQSKKQIEVNVKASLPALSSHQDKWSILESIMLPYVRALFALDIELFSLPLRHSQISSSQRETSVWDLFGFV